MFDSAILGELQGRGTQKNESPKNPGKRKAIHRIRSKRIFDVVVATVLLIGIAPAMLVIAWLIKRDGGPVFFGHHRLGASGQVFRCWKGGGWARYTMTAKDGSTATFGVCVKCRNRRGERGRYGREALVYAWGGRTRPSSPQWVKETYRQRFGIETSYRQMHQARIHKWSQCDHALGLHG